MTTFKGIRGTTIEVLSSDPSAPEEGQIWYNSSSGTLKGYRTVNAWSSGGNLSTSLYARGGFGTSASAALISGGETNSIAPYGYSTNVETYNGTSWTAGTALPQTNSRAWGAGILTAGILWGGGVPGGNPGSVTLNYNGSAWTSTGTLTVSRYDSAGNGTSTAALAFGGADSNPPYGYRTTAETFNSGTWTTATGLNTARIGLGSAPQSPNATGLAFGGFTVPGALTGATESWGGSAWTNLNSMNTARGYPGGSGTNTAALAFGGNTPTLTGATELWNGTAWTSNPTGLANARGRAAAGGVGSASATLATGGYNGVAPTNASLATEAWNSVKVQTITVS